MKTIKNNYFEREKMHYPKICGIEQKMRTHILGSSHCR